MSDASMPLHRKIIYGLILLSVLMLLYAKSINAPFVYDDISYITDHDPAVHMTALTWEQIKTAALKGKPAHRNLPNISFALNYYFSNNGTSTFGFHLVNIFIHWINGLLILALFIITLRLHGGGHPREGASCQSSDSADRFSLECIAFFAAALWLVHPLQTQSVTYIVQRMTSMAALFYLLSLLLYVLARLDVRKNGRLTIKNAGFFSGCILSGVCAVFSKENAATLPFFILLYEWFFFQNVTVRLSPKKITIIILMIFVFGIIAIDIMGNDPFQRILRSYTNREFTLPQRVMTEWRVVVYYVSLLVWPVPSRLNLDHDYPLSHSLLTPPTTVLALAAILGMILLILFTIKKDRLLSFAGIWFLGNLAIESSVIGIEIIYEHRVYLPAVFLCLWLARWMVMKIQNRRILTGVMAVILVLLSMGTWQRNTLWANDIDFWQDCAAKTPGKARPYQNLAYVLQKNGDLAGAAKYFHHALLLEPEDSVTLYNLGTVYLLQKHYISAIETYLRSIQTGRPPTGIFFAMAMASQFSGQFDAARDLFRRAMSIDPSNKEIRNQADVLDVFLRARPDPLDRLLAMMAQAPENTAPYIALGQIYEERKQPRDALTAYKKAAESSADPAQRRTALWSAAFLNAAAGNLDDAISFYRQGLAFGPNDPVIYFNIALLQAKKNQKQAVLDWLEQAKSHGFDQWDRVVNDSHFSLIHDTPFYRSIFPGTQEHP